MEFIKSFWDRFKVQAMTITEEEKNNADQNRPQSQGLYGDVAPHEEKGFDLYPERRGGRYTPSMWDKITKWEGRENMERMKCERKLYRLYNEGPLVKLMVGALKSSGCDIDLRRNFSCEYCKPGVNGGYDHRAQQVVICQNNVKNIDAMQTVVGHELIHMYDHCVNKTDFTDLDHLACTEIRAANLTSCSILGCYLDGTISFLDMITLDINKKHADCVKNRAAASVMASRNVSRSEVDSIMDRVFPYCYKDLEPIGRQPRTGSYDIYKAYLEANLYGYV